MQREVELSSPELSMMEKKSKQKYAEIMPIPFHSDDHINYQLENRDKILCALQPTSLLNSVVHQI